MTITDIATKRAEKNPGITIYVTPTCTRCPMTIKAIRSRGYEPTIVDLTEDPSAMAWVQSRGYAEAPVVAVQTGDELSTWSGHRPDLIVSVIPKVVAA